MQNRAVLVNCPDYESRHVSDAITRIFAEAGGLEQYIRPGDRVLIKPNLIAPTPADQCAQTHPRVIVETAKLIKDFGAKPFVADSPAWSTAQACIRILGISEELERYEIPVFSLNRPVGVSIQGVRVGISRHALEADVIINLPKLKAHQQLGGTFALKNMYGCVAGVMGKEKAWWHFAKGTKQEEFYKLVVAIYQHLNPAFTIIDGIVAMEGAGPLKGRPKPLGILVGGVDPVACEEACRRITGLEIDQLPLLKTAKQMIGLQCQSIEIIGDAIEPVLCTDFIYPKQIPVRFSLRRICKSTLKQILLLSKKLFSKKTTVKGAEY